MRVKKIDYTVGAGISQNKPYYPGERKYGKPGQEHGAPFKETLRSTYVSPEEIAELKEEGGVIKTEGTQFGRKIEKKIKKK